jgi:type IV pilus assembly protein PilP
MSPRFSFARVALVCVVATLAGCLKGNGDLEKFVADEKAAPSKTPITPVPAPKNFETFTYRTSQPDVTGHLEARRDPFGPGLKEKKEAEASQGLMPDPHQKEKLENYPLDSLKMVGTVGAGASMEGLVKDPDGTVNRVHLGNYLGQNNGKITAISDKRIDLVELIPEGNGRWPEHPTSIELGGSGK